MMTFIYLRLSGGRERYEGWKLLFDKQVQTEPSGQPFNGRLLPFTLDLEILVQFKLYIDLT